MAVENNAALRLKSLAVQNYRKFETYNVDFDQALTVLTGDNSAGKTSLLDAASVALGTYLMKLEHTRSLTIAPSDARAVYRRQGESFDRQSAYPVVIEASGFVDNEELTWSRSLNGVKSKTTIAGAAEVIKKSELMARRLVDSDECPVIPILVRYSTDRLWLDAQRVDYSDEDLTSSRTKGYEQALHASASATRMTRWFRKMSLLEWQSRRDNPAYTSVKSAIAGCFVRVSDMRDAQIDYDVETGRIVIGYTDEAGDYHRDPLAAMSDGYRGTLSLIADIAWRMATLNPALEGHVLETPGVVMIDEADLHLHPRWQARILGDLRSLFPNVQFIVTTHSPIVVASVAKEHVRVLGDHCAQAPRVETYGHDSNSVLEAVMGSGSRPEGIRDLFRQFDGAMDYGDYAKAQALIAQIEGLIGQDDPDLVAAKTSLELEGV